MTTDGTIATPATTPAPATTELAAPASAATVAPLLAGLDERLPGLLALYEDLHAHPELSFQEFRTAGVAAERLRTQGWEVTEGVGGTGVVGVLANGPGPVVLLRADMDALPVREETGLPYASTATGTDPDGNEVPVMHACGHDMHVTCLLGATDLLAAHREAWSGTVVAVFQPAEEVGGAPAMIEDGFLDRFPRAAVCLGQHVAPAPVGFLGTRPGPVMAASDSLRVTLFGRGGHGSSPETAVDPVVMAAAVVMRLQTVVSREIGAAQTAVVTVGSLHAGTKENIIPDTAELRINMRSTTPAVRDRILAAVTRIVRAEAAASGAPKEPEFAPINAFPVTVNDGPATALVQSALTEAFGEGRVFTLPQVITGSEDFGVFGTALGVPSVFWHFGGADPALYAGVTPDSLLENGLPDTVPANHSPHFAPVPGPTIPVGVTALLAAAAHWLRKETPGAA
ncbi:N-acetyl-L,L-diaminopimelate deacetylase [Streptomyces venezuelae]|uniref:amidohydrolase n=1 Tax=Streptomyces gardneri TaxID=66892 RepID=UPI0006BD06AC|nr:amidohydrolase [Streptomyces gardneri]ALO11772.1 N-acetyl-L,L-diaminopimelate deacetylase [Streptomyces venezuelae]QPK48638.1 amidohydrolase [Streptomyces gardneri]WRK40112.1 amidohydrolase [Streptomyces venezuelae]CUM37673.1 N-acetyl-L,L-diaminopimelate deacetylase [Streptomyces venezuelae]